MRSFSRPLCICLAAALLTTACGPAHPPITPPENVTLLTEDGFRLAATIYSTPVPNPGALVCVTSEGESREDWSALAEAVRRAGHWVIVVDGRGLGESTRHGDAIESAADMDNAAWREGVRDFAVAHEAALKAGVNRENVAVATSADRCALALAYGQAVPSVQALILVSPSLETHGLDAAALIAALPPRPVLLLYATGDTYGGTSARRMNQRALGFTELREYQGGAHGADLVTVSQHAQEQILLWLDTVFKDHDDAGP